MRQNTMFHAHLAAQSARETEKEWETAGKQEFVIVFGRRAVYLLKILFTNECIYDCKYCVNRSGNDVVRTSFTPEEVCTLTMEFYRRNYIEAILIFKFRGFKKSPNYTMELCIQCYTSCAMNTIFRDIFM